MSRFACEAPDIFKENCELNNYKAKYKLKYKAEFKSDFKANRKQVAG
ncbi:hypothetical protein CAter282_1813 [Collimonas arenae]|uniref:Uncharacterized protein n=1 Tax=Collimonas arenae TaxID=279058 RepID=A0A127QHP4_9BURK|nr:hypothetical protein CAter282_1813 [Collimonas arenae]